jgi:hypothetical protein
MRVTLVEEVAPGDVVPVGAVRSGLWNSPPPAEVRYRVTGAQGFRPPAGIRADFWDEDFLEDCDLFLLPPGWRLFGADVPERLRAAGYEVEVVTKAELEEARRRLEEEERRAKEAERQRLEALGREYRAWREKATAGLVETTVAPVFYLSGPGARAVDGWTELDGVRSRLLAGWPPETPGAWYTTGDTWYEVVLQDGTRLLVRQYGSAILFYAPPEKARQWYLERWEEEVKRLGFQGAAANVRRWLAEYDGCYGSDYYRFVRDEILGPEA